MGVRVAAPACTHRLSDAKCDGLSTVPSCLPNTHRHWTTQSKYYKGPDQPHRSFSVHPVSHCTIFIKHLLCARIFAGYYHEPRQTCLCTRRVHSTLGNKETPTLTKQSNKCKIVIVRSTRKEKFMVLKENVMGFFPQSAKVEKAHLSWYLMTKRSDNSIPGGGNLLCKGPVQGEAYSPEKLKDPMSGRRGRGRVHRLKLASGHGTLCRPSKASGSGLFPSPEQQ